MIASPAVSADKPIMGGDQGQCRRGNSHTFDAYQRRTMRRHANGGGFPEMFCEDRPHFSRGVLIPRQNRLPAILVRRLFSPIRPVGIDAMRRILSLSKLGTKGLIVEYFIGEPAADTVVVTDTYDIIDLRNTN